MHQEKLTLLLLGATGYIGGQFLLQLKHEHDLKDKFNIIALVRNPTQQRVAQLKELWDDITVVECNLEDSDAIIQQQCAKADYVINAGRGNHRQSIISTLEGLKKNVAAHSNKPPLYIHLSGSGAFSDNCRGEYVPFDQIPKYNDIGFDINTCPPTNVHIEQDKLIIEAGTCSENPIRTILMYPSWVYGVGDSPFQKITIFMRAFVDMFEKCGFAGTWGPGQTNIPTVHVKDVANAMVLVLRAALEGRADEGEEGFYFLADDVPQLIQSQLFSRIGDLMFKKGLVKQPGAQCMPEEITDSLGDYGWTMLGSNQVVIPQRMKKLGWAATETYKNGLLDSLEEQIDCYLRVIGKLPS